MRSRTVFDESLITTDSMNFLFQNKNIDGKIYLWDVKEFFGIKNYEKARLLRDRLEMLKNI